MRALSHTRHPPIEARHSEAGFSLIEVMIATALLATMGGILVSMLWMTVDGQRAVRDSRDRLHAARVALNTMSRELSMSFLSTHVDEEERRQTFFDGDSQQIDFTSLSHRRLALNAKESDAVEIGYKIGKDRRYPGQSVLIRRQKTPLDDSPGKGGIEDVLAVGVRKLKIEYWDANDEDWNSDWRVDFENLVESKEIAAPTTMGDDETIEHKTMLPYRVRISLEVEDSEGEETYHYGEDEGRDERELRDLERRHATRSHIRALRRDMEYDEDHERRRERGTHFREAQEEIEEGGKHNPAWGGPEERHFGDDADTYIGPAIALDPEAMAKKRAQVRSTPEYAGTSVKPRKGSRSAKHLRGAPRQESKKISVREAKEITRRIIERIKKESN